MFNEVCFTLSPVFYVYLCTYFTLPPLHDCFGFRNVVFNSVTFRVEKFRVNCNFKHAEQLNILIQVTHVKLYFLL